MASKPAALKTAAAAKVAPKSKAFSVDSFLNPKKTAPAKKNVAGNGGRPKRVQEAKKRTPVSDKLDREDKAFLKKISADIENGRLTEFTMPKVREKYKVGDPRIRRIRTILLDMGLLTKSGNGYKIAATIAA